jgi:hypothetical protein
MQNEAALLEQTIQRLALDKQFTIDFCKYERRLRLGLRQSGRDQGSHGKCHAEAACGSRQMPHAGI